MKKLLTILGAIGLTATAGLSVIACSKDKNEGNEIDPPVEETIEEIIKAFQEDLNKITTKVYNLAENQSKFTRIIKDGEDQGTYNFFNFNYLSNNFKNESNESEKVFNLRNDGKESEVLMLKDLVQLFTQQQFAEEIRLTLETGDNATRYRNIYMGSVDATLGGFKIAQDKDFKLTNSIIKDEQIYTIEMNISRDMYFKDAEGTKTAYQTYEMPLKIVIGQEGVIMNLIEEVTTKLPTMLYNNKETNNKVSTQLKYDDLKEISSNFKSYGNLNESIAKFINTDVFKEDLKKSIEEILTEEFPSQINFKGDIVTSESVKTSATLFEGGTFKQSKFWVDMGNNAMINSLFLKAKETKALDKNVAITELKKTIIDFDKNFGNFDNKAREFLKAVVPNTSEANEIVEQIYTYGNFALSNIEILINDGTNSDVALPIPTIQIPWTFSNTISEEFTDKGDAFLASLYEAILVLNEKSLQANADASSRAERLFDLEDSFKENIRNNSFGVSWQEIINMIEGNENKEQSLERIIGNTNTWSIMNAYSDFQEDERVQFEGLNILMTFNKAAQNYLVFKKYPDGKIGLGFKKGITLQQIRQIDVEYKVNLGLTRIQAKLPFMGYGNQDSFYDAKDAFNYIEDKDFYGDNRDRGAWVNQVYYERETFAIFVLD
ncbi:hypothetical protein CXP39_02805 [Mesoplasma syrphidae]|uniref:Lipoprotein n=1 Tax=Mesoplasma syrphidae TaxID=225999 RepID=A0A2K9CDI7_9MOLU|nr:lipoprotein [Mesoplasma syrphidae]AUF83714.1 hypothetical protein CXP39_02805 [Mesoplasma syrphidae]